MLTGEGATQRTVARATYADGTDRDVTHLVAFNTNNPLAAAIADAGPNAGAVTAGPAADGSGGAEAFLTARFDVHTVGVPADRAAENRGASPGRRRKRPRITSTKRCIPKLATLRIAPSDLCTDAEFVRRAYVDLVGVVPPADVTREFVADDDPGQADRPGGRPARQAGVRGHLGDEVGRVAANSPPPTRPSPARKRCSITDWLKEQIDGNVPVDEMVRELLASSGGTFAEPATNFYQHRDATR